MDIRPGLRAALLLIVAAIAGAAVAQTTLNKYPEPRVRFNDELRVGPLQASRTVRVDMRTWILAPGLKAERLPLPAEANVVIELHAGTLETLIGDKRESRKPGAIWILQPGEPIVITTGDDSVTLTTLAITPK